MTCRTVWIKDETGIVLTDPTRVTKTRWSSLQLGDTTDDLPFSFLSCQTTEMAEMNGTAW